MLIVVSDMVAPLRSIHFDKEDLSMMVAGTIVVTKTTSGTAQASGDVVTYLAF
jgi:uncharacterized protein YejL (UPF0352 family)